MPLHTTQVRLARSIAQDYLRNYGEPIPVQHLVERVCDIKHICTMVRRSTCHALHSLPSRVPPNEPTASWNLAHKPMLRGVPQTYSIVVCVVCRQLPRRPFGVSFLVAGWDAMRGYQLYKTDPSGGWGAAVRLTIGFRGAHVCLACTLYVSVNSELRVLGGCGCGRGAGGADSRAGGGHRWSQVGP
jgi:hypothetical protein